MSFRIVRESRHSQARLGILKTDHGSIKTPFFMPIATSGVVKTVDTKILKELGAQIILSNTYHLNLRPGLKLLKKSGGLHQLMNWSGPILTDSPACTVLMVVLLSRPFSERLTSIKPLVRGVAKRGALISSNRCSNAPT